MLYVASGIGSMPGIDANEQTRVIAGELTELPHVAELPARGPGADMIGRTVGMLGGVSPDFAVETTPSGWRLCDQPGRVMRRAVSWLGEDYDEAERHFAGSPQVKTQVCGPWTLAASIEMRNGERAIRDHGFCAEIAQVFGLAVSQHIADLQRRLPGSKLWVQIDEPLLPAVLAAQIRTASGLATYRGVDEPRIQSHLEPVITMMHAADAAVVVHCCATNPPVTLMRSCGADAVSVDLTRIDARVNDELAQAFDTGASLFFGVTDALPTMPAAAMQAAATTIAREVQRRIDAWGFDPEGVGDQVVLTPTCGLVDASDPEVRTTLTVLRESGRLLRHETSTMQNQRDGSDQR